MACSELIALDSPALRTNVAPPQVRRSCSVPAPSIETEGSAELRAASQPPQLTRKATRRHFCGSNLFKLPVGSMRRAPAPAIGADQFWGIGHHTA